ncbi:PIR Superfamily Protein [Plasmodium ovale wallikeri]|uniref:PIR Superfamily Protein n=1 Tax=Plasmodium ovale wallikeri TaxID=864142 RepID=A0A1A9AKK2_PLAOA|nr:PIR Superfamily Protein [Plasmodium ovale wallikeri]SBT56923.1 PIR Superfamily Protein [Plasmodium ovale wallikeri]
MITTCNGKSELPSCKIYELFNKEKGDSDEFNNDCNIIHGRLLYNGILDLCKRLGGNLLTFFSNDERNNSLNCDCEFLQYWLFNEIFKNSSLTDDSMHTGTLSQFYNTWEKIMKKSLFKKKCEPNNILFNTLSLQDLIFRKDMYDYIYNYDNFDKIVSSGEKICDKFSIYLPSMREKYETFKSSCAVSNKKCTHDIKSLEKYNPDNLCGRYSCQREELCSKYFQENSKEIHLQVAGSLQDVKREDSREGEAVTPEEESETSTIMTTVGPSLLGLFIISFISFKFTPIRSWLNERILKKRNIDEYLDDESSNEMLDNYFIPENGESGKNEYGLAYHSAENIGDYNI